MYHKVIMEVQGFLNRYMSRRMLEVNNMYDSSNGMVSTTFNTQKIVLIA